MTSKEGKLEILKAAGTNALDVSSVIYNWNEDKNTFKDMDIVKAYHLVIGRRMEELTGYKGEPAPTPSASDFANSDLPASVDPETAAVVAAAMARMKTPEGKRENLLSARNSLAAAFASTPGFNDTATFNSVMESLNTTINDIDLDIGSHTTKTPSNGLMFGTLAELQAELDSSSTEAPAAAAPASSGFTFGATSTKSPAPASGGFTFGSKSTETPAPASGGFTFVTANISNIDSSDPDAEPVITNKKVFTSSSTSNVKSEGNSKDEGNGTSGDKTGSKPPAKNNKKNGKKNKKKKNGSSAKRTGPTLS